MKTLRPIINRILQRKRWIVDAKQVSNNRHMGIHRRSLRFGLPKLVRVMQKDFTASQPRGNR